jgi:cytochrome b561
MTLKSDAALNYDTKTLWLHWLTAGLVISLWIVGQTIDWFPRGTPRVVVRSLHISAGTVLAMLLLYRLWWRSTGGAKLPPASEGMLQVLAKTVHIALYVGLFSTVALGVANAWVRGDNLFDLVKIPAFDPGNKILRHDVEEWHGLAANILLALAGLHAGAALLHHFLWKNTVLRRMLPFLKADK